MAITEFQTDTEIPVATVISVRKLSGKHTVYDVEVTNRHRFYANDLLVHNCLGRYHPHSDVGVEGDGDHGNERVLPD
jgi:DNA gyrase subunit A